MATTAVDTAEALAHAARLLQLAEVEPDPHRMERYEKIADSWINMAHLLDQRERV